MNTTIDPSSQFALGVGAFLVLVALYVWVGLALSAVFRKSGVAGWKAWVPFLNTFVLLELGGFTGWLVLLSLVPIVNIVLFVTLIVAYHRINVAFGHGAGMTVLAVFLFPVWATVLGFGASRWVGREGAGARRTTADASPAGPVRRGPAAPPSGAPAYPASPPPPVYGGSRSAGAPPAGAPPVGAPPAGAAPLAAPGAVPPSPGAWAPQSGQLPIPPKPPAPGAPGSAVPPAPAPASAPPVVRPTRTAPAADDPAEPAAPPTVPLPAVTPEGVPGPMRGRRTPAPVVDDDDVVDDSAPPWTMHHEPTSEVTAAEPGAPGPISAVPSRAEPPLPPPSPVPPVTRVPAAPAAPEREPWAPVLPPSPDSEAFPEASGPVSAIAGAPVAGTPRSARGSVSSLHTSPHVPTDDEALDETVVTRRKRTPWTIVPPTGRSIPVTSDVVILGRRPVADPSYPDAQLVALDDDTRTVSKTHARLELRDERWHIVDLDSTNGVLLTDMFGTESEAVPGVETEVGDRFLLGDAEVRLGRSDA